MLENNWFLHYPNCWATSGVGEGGNLKGMAWSYFLSAAHFCQMQTSQKMQKSLNS